MGAYLSSPKTDKESTDAELDGLLTVGTSSMQGWRNSQEDAHNAILEFDQNTSFFAVYDGHGGAEVATYCADKLPRFLRGLESYKQGNLEQALKDAFLGFDKTLLEPHVIDVLKILANEKNSGGVVDVPSDEDEDDEEDLAELHEESHLPLNEVLEKYKGNPLGSTVKRSQDATTEQSSQSPFLRGRRAAAIVAEATNKRVMDPEGHPAGSSTSAAAAALASASAGPSSSRAAGTSAVGKREGLEPEEDSTVSSSSSSGGGAGKSNNTNSSEATEAEATSRRAQPLVNGSTGLSSSTVAASVAFPKPDSSHNNNKENEQNGSVTSSDVTKPSDVSTSRQEPGLKAASGSAEDATVSGSCDPASPKDGKQNGNVGSSSSAAPTAAAVAADHSAISSTSRAAKKALTDDDGDSTDDDADYEEGGEALSSDDEHEVAAGPEADSSAEADDSSEDDDDDDEDDDAEDMDDDDDDDDDGDNDVDDDAITNQFCANMVEEPGKDSGCTAVVALLRGRDLYVANAGDSRCVVCRAGEALDMSDDHKPEDEEESARIAKAGGQVTQDGRVNGGLNLSRALGDHAYKMNKDLPPEEQMISALPDVKKLIISPEDEFMVLACDGIWNYMCSDEVVDFIRQRLDDETRKTSDIIEELFDQCLAPNTMGDGTGCDNMTAVIVRFKPKILEQPTVIDPKETVDATSDDEFVARKRSASTSDSDDDDDSSNEAANAHQCKRMKTDFGAGKFASASATAVSAAPVISSANVASSSERIPTSDDLATAPTAAEQKECDSVAMEPSDMNQPAVSST